MRFLEYPEKFLDRTIPCEFFKVIHDTDKRHDWWCVISRNDKNIKCHYKNKLILLYIDCKFNIETSIKLEEEENYTRLKNFLGFLDLKSHIFIRNKNYSGSIDITQAIKLLNEAVIIRTK